MPLASEIISRARGFVGDDLSSPVVTDALSIPPLQEANDELQDMLAIYGFSTLDKVASDVTIAAGAITYGTLPADFLLPYKLFEKGVGENDDRFYPMTEKDFEPNEEDRTTLDYWAFRDNAIKFRAATVSRVVRLQYYKLLGAITSGSSTYEFQGARRFLAARTAELYARDVLQNREMGEDLLTRRVIPAKSDLETILAQNSQGVRARRRRHNSRRYLYG